MRTVRFSDRLSCHACPPPGTHAPLYHAHPLHHTCLPLPRMPCFATHAPLCHTCPALPRMPSFATHAPLCHTCPFCHACTCLWKHYLSATTVGDGNKQVLVQWNLDHCVIPEGNWSPLRISCVSSSGVSVMMNSGVIWPSGWWSQCPTQQRSLLNRAVSLWINPINHCRDPRIHYDTTSWPVPFFQEGLHIWGSILCGLCVNRSFTSAHNCADPCVPTRTLTMYLGLATPLSVHFYRVPTQTGKPRKWEGILQSKISLFWIDWKSHEKSHKILENSGNFRQMLFIFSYF